MNEPNETYVVVDCLQTFQMRYVVKLLPGQTEETAKAIVALDHAREFSQKPLEETAVATKSLSRGEVVELARSDNKFVSEWSDSEILERIVTPPMEQAPAPSTPKKPKK